MSAEDTEKTGEPLRILDLGVGTGLEIESLLGKVPNALITREVGFRDFERVW